MVDQDEKQCKKDSLEDAKAAGKPGKREHSDDAHAANDGKSLSLDGADTAVLEAGGAIELCRIVMVSCVHSCCGWGAGGRYMENLRASGVYFCG